MRYLVFVFFGVTIFSCVSDDANPLNEIWVLGKWQLIEQLSDPGDGSGVFQPIDSQRIIEFFSDGSVTLNGRLCVMATAVGDVEMGTYQITSNPKADTTYDGEIIPNTCNSRSVKLYFDLPLNGDLILWYQCIEPCGQKFVKLD